MLKQRTGLSRLDVGVSIVVVLLLGSLAFQFLPYAREAARRDSCVSNLRQIGVALQNYHDTHRRLPPAATWTAEGIDVRSFIHQIWKGTVHLTHQNWVICVLPQLGEDELLSKFDLRLPIINAANTSARESELPLFRCPSDSYNRADNPYAYEVSKTKAVRFARGNYAINGGSHCIQESPGRIGVPVLDGYYGSFDVKRNEFAMWGSGVAGINKSFSFEDCSNGLATLVLVDEIRAGIHSIDPRGVWCLGQIGGSITWAHGVAGDACGPNPTAPDADDILRGFALHKAVGAERLAAEGMTACAHLSRNQQASARSQHAGGVNVLMCDGAVKFICNNVDLEVWHAIHSRLTPRHILTDSIDRLPASSAHREAPVPTPPVDVHSHPLISNAEEQHEFDNSIGMRFVRIPPGTFTMGLPDEGAPLTHEGFSRHSVTLPEPFYIGIYEVTQEQFTAVMGTNPSWFAASSGGKNQLINNDTRRCPVENVTWDDATKFCADLSRRAPEIGAGRWYRLPTEAEWEYCCRSGSSNPHHFTHDYDDSGELGCKKYIEPPKRVTPVGKYRPNAFGLFDMRGNVWEWCNDWFCVDYYQWSSSANPRGPANGFHKVLRGTDWIFTGNLAKNQLIIAAPWQRNPYVGFRVVCVIQAAQ
jgi:prepilin-type processing-associated H-X9-DG protein